MKTSIKNISKLVGLLLLAAVIVQGCSDVVSPDSNSPVLSENSGSSDIGRLNDDGLSGDETTCKTSGTYPLTAGQTYDAGTISYEIIKNKIYVTITAENGWLIKNSAVYVGDNLEGALNKGGSPSIGNFTKVTDPHDPMVSEFEYSINLKSVGIDYGDTLYILVHATVENSDNSIGEQTAWGGDKKGSKGWWLYVAESYNKCSAWGKNS